MAFSKRDHLTRARAKTYSWLRDGHVILVNDMSREELLSGLCDCLDIIEEINNAFHRCDVSRTLQLQQIVKNFLAKDD